MIKHKAMELVAALRSGDYAQGTGYLQQEEGQACCLGVACLLSGTKRGIDAELIREGSFATFTFGPTQESTALPDEVKQLFGFATDDGTRRDQKLLTFPNGSKYYSLAKANDSGITFREIADYIEANWEQL